MDQIIAELASSGRKLTRTETHDLSMIIKDRVRVLKAHVEEQQAACLADFETKLAACFSFDQQETWSEATQRALLAIKDANATIAERCAELGIPKSYAPRLVADWQSRGENAVSERRAELRRVAKSQIEAMSKAAITKIEKQSLELRTRVVAMGELGAEAANFLESLAPVDDMMKTLNLADIEKRLESDRARRPAIGHYV